MSSKLVLGTAQFGLDYGITNLSGQIQDREAYEILKLAKKNKIDSIDTAISYGQSESRLGVLGVEEFKIITKLPEFPIDELEITNWTQIQIFNSLKKLNVNQLEGVLIHRPQQLFSKIGREMFKTLYSLKREGVIKKIGISIYSPLELETLVKEFNFDIVQAPINIFDNRLENSNWLSRLKDLGVEVYARSIFLQGLLLLQPNKLPTKFKPWESLFLKWNAWLSLNPEVSGIETCLKYVSNKPGVTKIIFGVDNTKQLNEVIKAYDYSREIMFPQFLINDDKLLNPFNWHKL